ncbi:MAG: asparagine synthase (glutamine-hydrolyzing) [Candidatus Rokubacteria bacterium]|nr:asparagine synthase (glutamine-hydrolyzing) [Candidatus Rokubacteria bacterium]MBI3827524.1 asparagine synthase (glutamine-hydrolyzing) [Candidatus Rokubacteria bacterium]
MCGIAGYVGASPPELLPRMLAVLRHRGPDGEGCHLADGAGLGMTRLAIIDLVSGDQPMANHDETVWIVFNGEIYNFQELRATLEAKGYRFRTRSDTEAILHAYEEFGDACVDQLKGMFAFAIWDERRRRMLLARDRLGKKPLYLWRGHGLALFASEIKALLMHPAVSRDLDWDAFHHYLAFGCTPGDRSILRDVEKLPPAHRLVLERGAMRVERYWELPDGEQSPRRQTAAEARRAVRRVVVEAVRRRLQSDVPLGVFLSGGIDSSVIVAAMREVTNGPIATFSVGFRDAPTFDELPDARLVAERFETRHHEEILDPDVTRLALSIPGHFDEPFADSSALPTLAVAEATARHVKVALSGVGGDEAFAGYPRYLGVRVSTWYERIPAPLRFAMGAVVRGVARSSGGSRDRADWARRFVASAEQALPHRYIAWTRFFGEADLQTLVDPEIQSRWRRDVERPAVDAFARRGYEDPVDGAFRIDLATYLPDDLLTMADRATMAHSLELRAPYCDHELLQEALGLAPALKMPRFRLKGLLKASFADALPPAVLARPKRGFMVPMAVWLRNELGPLVEDLLSPARVRARGIFVPATVQRLVREHMTGARVHSDRLWALMMAELWMRQRLDGAG